MPNDRHRLIEFHKNYIVCMIGDLESENESD